MAEYESERVKDFNEMLESMDESDVGVIDDAEKLYQTNSNGDEKIQVSNRSK